MWTPSKTSDDPGKSFTCRKHVFLFWNFIMNCYFPRVEYVNTCAYVHHGIYGEVRRKPEWVISLLPLCGAQEINLCHQPWYCTTSPIPLICIYFNSSFFIEIFIKLNKIIVIKCFLYSWHMSSMNQRLLALVDVLGEHGNILCGYDNHWYFVSFWVLKVDLYSLLSVKKQALLEAGGNDNERKLQKGKVGRREEEGRRKGRELWKFNFVTEDIAQWQRTCLICARP